MIVDSRTSRVNLSRVFTLNETAAWLWQKAGDRSFTSDMLVGWLCEAYDVTPETARQDVGNLLKEWRQHGLLSDDE